MKVLTLVGTRPELIRLSRLIPALDRAFEHTLVHTGQNHDYELNEVFFRQLEIRKPDAYLDAARPSAAETIAAVIERTDRILEQYKPDAFLVLGDTNSAFGAISAKKRKIPIFHMEAGNRCFDQRVPEEVNRKLIDHLSDINLTYSSIAREYLLREGFAPDRVIQTGSPMMEVIESYRLKWESSSILADLGLQQREYFVLSAHREENVDSPEKLRQLVATLDALSIRYPAKKVVFSIHPRTRRRLTEQGLALPANTIESKPLGFLDYLRLQVSSYAVLSDSGTITEEASILGFRALNLRDAHERPEGMLEAAVMMTSVRSEEVLSALSILEGEASHSNSRRIVADYDVSDFSAKVTRIIQSYTHYVNRFVWRKSL
jgi:UDP-N-acetylglucosamine 2-epimerase (non-hydrolysing)